MPYQVALLNFEGPLDLLLQLIERSDLEITEISLSEVTAQYLAYAKQLPYLQPHELNQFLELAARLIYLKSLALLPQQPTEEIAEEVADLTSALEQYKTYQTAARHLDKLLRKNEGSWVRENTLTLPPQKLPLPRVSLGLLEQSFASALANIPETAENPTRNIGISLAEMTSKITVWIETNPGYAHLQQFLAGLATRNELVIAFIATLELIRTKTISVSQDSMFGDIMVILVHNVKG